MAEWFVYLFSGVAGVIGGLAARRLPASGKAALALAGVPAVGVGLLLAFC